MDNIKARLRGSLFLMIEEDFETVKDCLPRQWNKKPYSINHKGYEVYWPYWLFVATFFFMRKLPLVISIVALVVAFAK